jgi:hypothetical protein
VTGVAGHRRGKSDVRPDKDFPVKFTTARRCQSRRELKTASVKKWSKARSASWMLSTDGSRAVRQPHLEIIRAFSSQLRAKDLLRKSWFAFEIEFFRNPRASHGQLLGVVAGLVNLRVLNTLVASSA